MSNSILAPELQQMVEAIADALGVNPGLYLQHLIIREWVAHRRAQIQGKDVSQYPREPELKDYEPYDYETAVVVLERS